MLGFALFRPICPFASSTCKAIEAGITNLEIFGTNNFASALSAANVARSLSEHIDLYRKDFQMSLMRSSRTPSSAVETPRQGMSMETSLHLSDNQALFDQANKSLPFARSDSSSAPITAFAQMQAAPVTAEEFASRIAAGMHSDNPLWLMDQNVDPGTLDMNMEMWANWMNDR